MLTPYKKLLDRLIIIVIIVYTPKQHKIVQERPAVADKPARRLRKVCTVYVRVVGL